ncbi:tryptophan-rich sensory protein [Croceibacterium sp. LX-88]|jgi:tryptophan-rich sensory protein|uniref:Tryptophan-rich sensory protein n=1 Tax=Croceibacterium selenioxidans TaxID=2838833 RepID=A0ABS5W0K0_9SPHN|nr:TspO/MBR family protein [Croceibacterium selenioxidans]MBT2133298.1 tryptophan-rich sensory protein [Croceibacterium selenioxidans]
MNRLASPAQLRASFVRWSLFLVPAVLLLGRLSGLAGGDTSSDPWFMVLDKPSIFPPPAAFGIVWPILYTMMGFAMAIVCSAWGSRYRSAAIVAFIVQLAINLAWNPIFFAAHEITLALIVIGVLNVAVIVTIVLFWKVRRSAALLMLPYLAWLLFATVLNWQFLRLNPDADGVEVSAAVQRFEL